MPNENTTDAKSSITDFAIYYLLYGDGRHRTEIDRSITSLRKYHNEKIYVISDRPFEHPEAETIIVPPFPDETRFLPKLDLHLHVKTEYGLFLDTDTFILDSLQPLIDILDAYSIILPIGHNGNVKNIKGLEELPAGLPYHNTGFMVFKSSTLKEMDLHAREEIERRPDWSEEFAINAVARHYDTLGVAQTIQPRNTIFYRESNPGKSLVWHNRADPPTKEYKFHFKPLPYTTPWLTRMKPFLEKNLNYFKGKPTRMLEIGTYEGQTARWLLDNILKHADSTLTCVDPFMVTGVYDGVRAKACWQQNIPEIKAELIVGTFKDKRHMFRDEEFDIILVDGDHTLQAAWFDSMHAWPLLRHGGCMVWDDTNFDGVGKAVRDFMVVYHGQIESREIGTSMIRATKK